MRIVKLLSKLLGIAAKVKWSRGKKLEVSGPEAFGVYHIYVDRDFRVAVFLPKADGHLTILVGDIVKGRRFLVYGPDGAKKGEAEIPKGEFEWKINPDRFLFKTAGVPRDQLTMTLAFGRVCAGDVTWNHAFNGEINEEWLETTKDDYLLQMREGRLEIHCPKCGGELIGRDARCPHCAGRLFA